MKLRFVILFVSVFMLSSQVFAQGLPRVQCGDTLTAEFTGSRQTLEYRVALQPGDTIQVTESRFGDYLQFYTYFNSYGNGIYAPSGSAVAEHDRVVESTINLDMRSGILGERGDYTIRFRNTNPFGAFTFSVTCTRNGEPYNETQPTPTPVVPNPQPGGSVPQVTFGYPGVAAIDFSVVNPTVLNERIFGIPITSNISVDGSGVSAFSFEAAEGDILEIDARRSQGNLGIGFVVFAEPNIPVFIAGPVSASTFSTQIELPQDGSYVIGLFRMGELPANAQATVFQITVNLNP